jgi:hypothetical protein
MAELVRMTVRAQMCLSPGLLRLELELPPSSPETVWLFEGVSHEVQLDLVPQDLQAIGSRFVIVFEPWGRVVEVERLDVEPSAAPDRGGRVA